MTADDMKASWTEIVKLQKIIDETRFNREFDARRFRLGAEPVDTIKSKLMLEITKDSMMHEYMKQLLAFDSSIENLIAFFDVLVERVMFDKVIDHLLLC
jgi:hypothetical protein